MFSRSIVIMAGVVSLVAALGCGDGATSPSGRNSVVIHTPTPQAGSTIQTTGTTPGAFIDRESGKLNIPITIQSANDEPVARLFVYLRRDSGTCGQNVPDAPDFSPLDGGDGRTYTVTGFQVFSLPCDVTSIRAVLHRRESRNLNTELLPAEIIAETTLPVSYFIR